MIRSPRKKNPPKKFTPTKPNLYSQENYLLRFEDNDELIVIKRSSIGSIIEDKAIVGTGSKRRFAIIEAKDILDAINDFEDDDTMNDDNDQNEIPKQSSLTKKRKLSSLMVENNDASVVYQTIDDMHHMILQKLEKKFHSFTKKLDQLIPHAVYQNLDSYREKDEVFPSQVIYEGKDLLITRGRDIYDFARKTLNILYTPKELSTCILPPARRHLARPALDPERFNLFHGT
ncbi:unnamed protein product [Rotaria sordida]|uniref:Uncharacterized protein n=1 Tax=Rotaria sordida TaxID=392033 RepID=A0A815MP55_9BILA|nr:unnamed protein product [Rotaria sordida]CAF1240988.1 unnamed protein product [Rotaria sordida]CAF1252377.1 unnamed protein product [Rotaria sordida]CAF1425652.1 unnamed protein product [Rotaria sordida]